MEFIVIDQASPYFQQVLELRNRVLRMPLGLNLADEDLSEENDQFTIIILKEEKVAASLMLKVMGEGNLKLRQMVVDTPFQHTGLGTMLLGYAENFCMLNNYLDIELNARKPAVEFYKKSGYELIGDEFEEVGIPHVRMEKHLTLHKF